MITTRQAGSQTADFTDVRATNLAVVLRDVRANAPCSRADIAVSTGLNKATVSSLVAELIDRQLLRETGLVGHRVGRPATMLMLDGAPYAAIGVEVDAGHVSVEAVDLVGDRVLSWRRAVPGLTASAPRAVASIGALIRRAVARVLADGRQVLGLTIAVPGQVDVDGVVTTALSLGWHDLDLRGEVVRALRDPGFPVLVDNDAILAAVGEHRFGGFGGTAHLIHLRGQLGLAAGIITDGRPLRGVRGFAGEIGHLPLDGADTPCHCGRRGCLEAVAGIPAIIDRIEPRGAGEAPPLDLEREVARIAEHAAAHDAAVLKVLEDAGGRLGQAIATMVNIVNPEAVLLGGYYVPLARWLLPAAQAELTARAVAPDAGGCRLAASTLGHGAAALGATARILDAVDAGHLPRRAV